MRTKIFMGACMLSLVALPAAADGYANGYSANSTQNSYSGSSYTTTPDVSSCCCGPTRTYTHTYSTAPVVTRTYTRTYSRVAVPDCHTATSVAPMHKPCHTAYTAPTAYQGQQGYSYGSSAAHTSGSGYAGGYYADSGYSEDAYGDNGYYEDGYYDDGYYAAPSSRVAAGLSLDREDPWNGYYANRR
jgi:hypothetical protein